MTEPHPTPVAPAAPAPLASGWEQFHRRVVQLRPPLSPHPADVAAIARQIANDDAHVLLLGMTAALFGQGQRLTAIDFSAPMIARLWPGDTATHRALEGDWRGLAPPDRPYTAVIGDGSFNTLAWPHDIAAVGARLAAAAPGAVLAVRCFLAPPPAMAESLDDLAAAAAAGTLGGFHAAKWRIAMALAAAAGDPNVPVVAIAAAFDALFPDRAALSAATGWTLETIAEIDAYRGSPACLAFPTAAQLLAALGTPPGAGFVAAGGYELADRCPLLVWHLPG